MCDCDSLIEDFLKKKLNYKQKSKKRRYFDEEKNMIRERAGFFDSPEKNRAKKKN